MNATETELLRDLLDTRVQLDLSINELRIILGCFRAVEYQMLIDGKPCLDVVFALKDKLERQYNGILNKFGGLC